MHRVCYYLDNRTTSAHSFNFTLVSNYSPNMSMIVHSQNIMNQLTTTKSSHRHNRLHHRKETVKFDDVDMTSSHRVDRRRLARIRRTNGWFPTQNYYILSRNDVQVLFSAVIYCLFVKLLSAVSTK